FFDAQARARAEVKANLAGVHLREEIAAKDENQPAREHAENQKACGKSNRNIEGGTERATVSVACLFETMLKFLLVAAEEALFFAAVLFGDVFVFCAEEIHRHRRNDGSRPHV